jgi:hypothetical protein
VNDFIDTAKEGLESPPKATSYSEVTDARKSISLQIPSNWRELGKRKTLSGDDFDLRVGSKRYRCQIEIITQSTLPFEHRGYQFEGFQHMSADDYAQDRFKDLNKHSDRYHVRNGPFTIQINGIYGQQYVIDLIEEGREITVLYTLLKSETAFHQIVGQLDPDHLDEVKPELLEIVRSFRELKDIQPRIGVREKLMTKDGYPILRIKN